MDSLILLVLLIFSSNSSGDKILELSPIGDVFDNEYEYVEEGEESAPIPGDSDNPREAQTLGWTSEISTQPGFSSDDYTEGENYTSSPSDGFSISAEPFPTTLSEFNEPISDDVGSAIPYGPDYYEYLRINQTKFDQPLRRRDLNDWKESDGMFEMNTYNPREESQEFYEDPSYMAEKYVSEVGGKHPQYYQKNYYYNYYPLMNGRRYVLPNGPEIYETDGGSRRTEIAAPVYAPRKKVNPCRQYLEFLRYAFQRLDKNLEYQYDYNEYGDDWRDTEPYRNPAVFGTRLYGPTLYIDNSGKAYQLNYKQQGAAVDDRIFPVTKDAVVIKGGAVQNPIVPPPSRDGVSRFDIHTSFSTPDPFNSKWKSGTGYSRPGTTTDNPEDSLGTTTISPVNEDSDDITGYKKWWKTLKTDNYPTTATEPYNLGEPDGETKGTLDDFDFHLRTSQPSTTTSPTPFNSEDYYSVLGNMRDKPETTMESINSSLFYWTSRNMNFEKTTMQPLFPPIPPISNSFSSKTVISIDGPSGDSKKEPDCNDKMLPCPDTVNITYPLNGYCNRYVSCESGRAIRKTCPDGLHFNIIIKSCDIPHNSFCTYSCPTPNGHFGIPGDCGGYFACKDSIPEYRMCPPKMHWDPQRSICTFAELSRCPMKCVKANEVKHYEGDCKAYIVCLNGSPFYHKCPPNSKFDTNSLSCVPEMQSKCEDDPRLLTKTLNPNVLCRDVEVKVGTKTWCSFFTG